MSRSLRVSAVLLGAVLALVPARLPWGGVARSAEAAPAGNMSFPVLQAPLNVTADEVTVDNTGTGLVARGHVRMTYQAGVATADAMRLVKADRVTQFTGHVIVTDPHGRATGDDVTVTFTPDNQVSRIVMAGNAAAESRDYSLQADHILADRAAHRLAADGHVTAFSAPDLIINGDRATYNQDARYGVVSGHAVVSNRGGRMLGDWVELFQDKQQAAVHGPVAAEVYGATITGQAATIDFVKASAVFAGHVTVTRRQGTLSADRVTIFYNDRRLVAEGTTHARFTDLDSDSTP